MRIFGYALYELGSGVIVMGSLFVAWNCACVMLQQQMPLVLEQAGIVERVEI